jgi:hypothetical protein
MTIDELSVLVGLLDAKAKVRRATRQLEAYPRIVENVVISTSPFAKQSQQVGEHNRPLTATCSPKQAHTLEIPRLSPSPYQHLIIIIAVPALCIFSFFPTFASTTILRAPAIRPPTSEEAQERRRIRGPSDCCCFSGPGRAPARCGDELETSHCHQSVELQWPQCASACGSGSLEALVPCSRAGYTRGCCAVEGLFGTLEARSCTAARR